MFTNAAALLRLSTMIVNTTVLCAILRGGLTLIQGCCSFISYLTWNLAVVRLDARSNSQVLHNEIRLRANIPIALSYTYSSLAPNLPFAVIQRPDT